MNKRKFTAAAAAMAMTASIAMSASFGASAENTYSYTPVNGGTVSFAKYLAMKNEATVPNVTFEFTVAPIDDDEVKAATDTTLAVMRFNLAAVKPGQVRLTKEVTTDDQNLALDYELVEYPFQIYYKVDTGAEESTSSEESDSTGFTLLTPSSSLSDYIGVYYANSTRDMNYKSEYTPVGTNKTYEHVYFLNAGESVFIDFPDNTIEYYIVECGIDTDVYDKVKCNGDKIDKSNDSHVSGSRYDFSCGAALVSERPAVTYENHVDPDAIRDLTFTKDLYDENGIAIHDDPTTFDFRIYLDSENEVLNSLGYANMHKYHVISPDNYLCKWDADNGKFVKTSYVTTPEIPFIEDFNTATAAEKEAYEKAVEKYESVTFYTSPNGSVSKIPAWYKVRVIDLPVGTKFKVTEKFDEIPLGYDLGSFERTGGSYIVDEGDPDNTGIVRDSENPAMTVKNKRGYGIIADKVWADKDVTSEHAPIYMALYKKNGDTETLVSGTIKRLAGSKKSVKWYLEHVDGSLANYIVRELRPLSNAVYDEDGNVTAYTGEVVPLADNGTGVMTIDVKPVGSESTISREYSVGYSTGNPTGSADVAGLKNIRTDTVTNTPIDQGLKIWLSEWNGTDPERDFRDALPGGQFSLILTKENGDTIDYGKFTSASDGLVAVLYGYEKGENNIYTLTETHSPAARVGTSEPLSFCIKEDTSGRDRIVLLNAEDDGWVNHKDSEDTQIIGDVIVYNKTLSLKMIKYKGGTSTPLAGAEFELYRGTKQPDGVSYLKNYYPLEGYTSLVSGDDGIIPQIDEYLPSNRYFLREKRAPAGYEPFNGDIEFHISDLGEIELISCPNGVSLHTDTTIDGKVVCEIRAGNTKSGTKFANLTITKKVGGSFGSKTKEFTFTLEVEDAEGLAAFSWTKNGAEQESISSGGTFRLRHGDTAVFSVPKYANITVTEDNGTYDTVMKLNNEDEVSGNSLVFKLDSDSVLSVTNTLDGDIPTGVLLSFTVSLLLVLVPLFPIVAILYKKRKTDDMT